MSPSEKNLPLDEARDKWKFLGMSFPNVTTDEELNRMLTSELPRYSALEDPAEGIDVDEWWAQVLEVEVCEEKFVKHLPRLALGLATIYNFSSEAERDISKLNGIYAGDKKTQMKQETIVDKMTVQAAGSEEAKSCERCIANDKKRDSRIQAGEIVGRRQTNHCHCSFITPDPEVLADLRAGGPGRRYNQKQKENKSTENNKNLEEKH